MKCPIMGMYQRSLLGYDEYEENDHEFYEYEYDDDKQ
jgi:hypothetical protein